MIFIFLAMLGGVAGVLAFLVFLCALPFLQRPQTGENRFGVRSPTTSLLQAVSSGLRQALDFDRRSNRMDFWIFAVFVGLLCGLSVAASLGLMFALREHPTWWSALPLLIIPILALPSLAVAARRLHDINKSGWWLLLLLVFGYFVLFYWFIQPPHDDIQVTVDAFS